MRPAKERALLRTMGVGSGFNASSGFNLRLGSGAALTTPGGSDVRVGHNVCGVTGLMDGASSGPAAASRLLACIVCRRRPAMR